MAVATTTPVPQIANTSPKPADLLWAASLMLLLGTVGVLIVARIALAAVMALGPIFIILALFRGTRGLFEGWLKAAVMLAITPMLAVLLGGGTLVLVAPMISALARAGGKVSLELATSIFLAAFVYIALMILAMRAAAMITSGWHLGGRSDEASDDHQTAIPGLQNAPLLIPLTSAQTEIAAASSSSDRVRGIISGMSDATAGASYSRPDGVLSSADRRANIVTVTSGGIGEPADTTARDPRIRPLGQGFRMPQRITS